MLIENSDQIRHVAFESGREAHQGDQSGQLNAAFDVAQMILAETGSLRDNILREIA